MSNSTHVAKTGPVRSVVGASAANASPTSPAPLSPAVLDALAARLRPAGVCLLMLHPDGSVAYQDPAAGLFFTRFALPLCQSGPANQQSNQPARGAGAPAAGGALSLPGVVL